MLWSCVVSVSVVTRVPLCLTLLASVHHWHRLQHRQSYQIQVYACAHLLRTLVTHCFCAAAPYKPRAEEKSRSFDAAYGLDEVITPPREPLTPVAGSAVALQRCVPRFRWRLTAPCRSDGRTSPPPSSLPFNCGLCSTAFATSKEIQAHMESKHPDYDAGGPSYTFNSGYSGVGNLGLTVCWSASHGSV